MVLDETHIRFLRRVERGEVIAAENLHSNMAVQMQILGMTHMTYNKKTGYMVSLTAKGQAILDEEDESWT